ncbi:MAG: DUF3109 family protein [Bacteroidota bacterium]
MIAIENILISDDVISCQFVCDLNKCKGGCCEDGDAGAPLSKQELEEVKKAYERVKPYMTKEGIETIEKNGLYQYDREFGWVTPSVGGKICAYGYRDKKGIILCAFEQAFNEGKIQWKKPISCHLYPIKIKKSSEYEMVNYEPRETMCSPACALGEKLKVPAYVFLKNALVRKYGEDFYRLLEQAAKKYFEGTKKTGM